MRILRFPFAALLLVLGTAFFCNAEIACEVNQTIGAGGVTGDIITDGTIGVLGAAEGEPGLNHSRESWSTYETRGRSVQL